MGSSLTNGQPSLPLKTLVRTPAKASIAVNRDDSSQFSAKDTEAIAIVFASIAAVGMSDKEAAYDMAMDPAQLSRIKSGQGRLPFDALWRLPDRFWSEFADRIEAAKGLGHADIKRIRAARISELVRLLVEEVA